MNNNSFLNLLKFEDDLSENSITMTASAVKHDTNKMDWSLIPTSAINEVLKVLEFGKRKYDKHNWHNGQGFDYSRIYSAIQRHLTKWFDGLSIDEESNCNHLASVICNCIFLLTQEQEGYGNDDRDFRLKEDYGDVKLLKYLYSTSNAHRMYLCLCKCGQVFVNTYANIKKGNTKSCGCDRYSRSVENNKNNYPKEWRPYYGRWITMLSRCYNPSSISYRSYGGRGIRVCQRWNKFSNFMEDMGVPDMERPSIDRIDNDGDYTPENCKWLSLSDNIRRNTKK